MKNTVFLVTALAGALYSGPALAGGGAFLAPLSTTVHIGDIDRAAPAGRAALDRRIARAARQVCTVLGDRSLIAEIQARKCRVVAIASAERQLAQGMDAIVLASR